MNDGSFFKKTDEELMLLYQGGREQAFEELYRRYSGKIYSYITKRLSNKDWADDVFQLVFTKFHKTRSQYDSRYRFDQWIYVMTKTVLLDFWKTTEVKTKRFYSKSIENLKEAELPIIHPVEKKLIDESIVASLSLDQRAAIELKFIDELSYNEMANKLGCSEESIRQLVSRAIRKLRSQIKISGGKS